MKLLLIPVSILAMASFAQAEKKADGMQMARTELVGKNGSKVAGSVNFHPVPEGLSVQYRIEGLKPNSMNGFHVHEKGDCSATNAKTAGGHYMKISDHGGTSKDNPAKYAGDLPQLQANTDGVAEGSFTVAKLSIDKDNPIVNRALIVHDGPDDIQQKSAARIACGVIQVVK